jgi:hypothetical protein
MLTVPTKVQTKVVGTSGQISLGKQYAGQQVIIEEIEPGEWRIQTAITIPRSQAWVHSKTTQTQLVESLKWASTTPPKATDLGKLAKKLGVGNAIK